MKSLRPIFLISGVITLVTLGVVAFLMFYGPDKIQLSGRTLSDLFESGDLWSVLAIPIVLIVSGLAMLPFMKIIFPPRIKDGIKARATVVKVWDTGTTINDNPQVGMLLEVKPLAGGSFQAEAKTVVSRLKVALVQPGVTAEVLYDPNKPQRLQVLTIHVEGTAGESTGPDAASRMEQLNELHVKQLISEEEYKQKREEILRNL